MKYYNREISDLHDLALLQAYQNCEKIEEARLEASKHRKFDKNNSKNVGAFPPPNPAFIELKNELKSEIEKRKLDK